MAASASTTSATRSTYPTAGPPDDRDVACGAGQIGDKRIAPLLEWAVHQADRHPSDAVRLPRKQVSSVGEPASGGSHTRCAGVPRPASRSHRIQQGPQCDVRRAR